MDSTINSRNSSGVLSEASSNLHSTAGIDWDWFHVVQLCLALFGIIGNILILMVYMKKLRFRSNSNLLIAVLAVADLITSIAMIPLPTKAVVPQTPGGSAYCKLFHSAVIMWIAIVASVFTLTLLSLERYFAVIHPIRHNIFFRKNRIHWFIAAVWCSAVVINCGSFYVPVVSADSVCVLRWPSPAYQAFYGVMLFLIEFVLPVIVMVVSHYLAIQGLKQKANALLERNESKSSPAFSLLRSRRRVIKMVLIVVVTFIICWGPDQIGFLLLNLGIISPAYFLGQAYRCFTALAFLNSCVNPIIYIFLNRNFRGAVMQLFPCAFRKVASISEEGTGPVSGQPEPEQGADDGAAEDTKLKPPWMTKITVLSTDQSSSSDACATSSS